jgi:hypothetical protein
MLTSQKTASREMRFSRNQACIAALLFAVAWLNYIHRLAMNRCQRPADLLIPYCRQPTGIAGLFALVKE